MGLGNSFASFVNGFASGRDIRHKWEDRADEKERQKVLDGYEAERQKRLGEAHGWDRDRHGWAGEQQDWARDQHGWSRETHIANMGVEADNNRVRDRQWDDFIGDRAAAASAWEAMQGGLGAAPAEAAPAVNLTPVTAQQPGPVERAASVSLGLPPEGREQNHNGRLLLPPMKAQGGYSIQPGAAVAPAPVQRTPAEGLGAAPAANVVGAVTQAIEAVAKTPAGATTVSTLPQLGIAPGQALTPKQMDQVADRSMRAYREKGASIYRDHLMQQGRFEEAQAFDTFISDAATQEGLRQWHRAGAAILSGDEATAVSAMADAFNDTNYNPSPFEVVKDQSSLIKDDLGETIGVRLVMRNRETGEVTVEEDQVDNVLQRLHYHIAPENAMARWQERAKPKEFRTITGAEAKALGLDPEKAYNLGSNGEVKAIGGGGVTVNNNGGSKFDDEFAKTDAAALATVAEAGLAATRNISRIEQLEALLDASPSGFAAAAALRAGEWGINTEGLDTIQAAQALINSLVPEQRQPGSGPMSDADLALFKQSLPRIINQPGGNKRIIDTMRAIAQYDAEGAQIVQQLRDGKINRAEAFQLLQGRRNPLDSFGDGTAEQSGSADEPTATAPTGNEPSPQHAGQLAPGHIEDGFLFKGGDPADPSNWEQVQ
ncbi:hypothetical protein [Paracoccus sp. SY]|uniref:hypothetical protein n=1 Tax=Paracoccus sp. SY TaxID=1330255 RepID=UPI000CD18B9A|nr:hypothetical protein [Paracoccus sp. SY]